MTIPNLEQRDATISIVPLDPVPLEHTIAIASISVLFLFLTWTAVSLRFITRLFINRALGWDDWLMFVTLSIFTAFQSCILRIAFLVNKNTSYLTAAQMSFATNMLIAGESLYVWDVIFFKLSLAIFFLRILVDRWQRKTVYVVVSLATFVGFGYFWYAIFQCGVPNDLFWEKRITHECKGEAGQLVLGMGYLHAAVTAGTDLVLASLPIPVLIRARIALREKFIVGGILIMALIGCIASLIRLHWITALADVTLSFWDRIEFLVIWSTVETGLGIVAASCATLRPLLRRFSHWFGASLTPKEVTPESSKHSHTITLCEKSSEAETESGRNHPRWSKRVSRAPQIPLPAFLRERLDKRRKFLLSTTASQNTNQPSAFFLDTLQTVDSIDRHFAESQYRHFGEALPVRKGPEKHDVERHAFDPPDKREEEDLKSNYWSDRSRRATWWPLPRMSLIMDDEKHWYI